MITKMTANNNYKENGKWLNRSIKFYEYINIGAAFLYKQVKKIDYAVPREEAVNNLDNFINAAILISNCDTKFKLISEGVGEDCDCGVSCDCECVEDCGEDCDCECDCNFQCKEDCGEKTIIAEAKKRGLWFDKDDPQSLKEKLESFGNHYISLDDIQTLDDDLLFNSAVKYDFKGLVPGIKEELSDFVYRANSMLFVHRLFREKKIEPKIKVDESDFDISIEPKRLAKLIKKEDLAEASSQIPYNMDLSWVAGFIGDGGTGILAGAYGVCFTLPKYSGLNFLMMRERYKTRKAFIDVLSHEMAHMGTVYLDTKKDFLETKAYAVGSAAFGEYTIATNKRPDILTRAIRWGLEYFLHINLPKSAISMIPKLHSAVSIATTRNVYKTTKDNLQSLYGEEKGNYILGRLSADEIEEFCYTNDLSARLAKKDNLKWKIMNHNVAELEDAEA